MAKPSWSLRAPTSPGWYWCAGSGGVEDAGLPPFVIEVVGGDASGSLRACVPLPRAQLEIHISMLRGWRWYSKPIAQPPEPTRG